MGICGFLALALSAGAIYQAVAGNVDETRYPPPGRLVDVGGRRLHLYCIGEGRPPSSSRLDLAGAWGLGVTYSRRSPKPRKYVRTTAPDGWSDVGRPPRASSQVSSDLHVLLQRAAVRAPFVLVGHSLGGLYLQYYAATYPIDVAGMVLVESSHEDEGKDPPSRLLLVAMKGIGATGFGTTSFPIRRFLDGRCVLQ